MSIKVRSYKISKGRQSLYLDIYVDGKREPREVLEIYLYPNDTFNNKEKIKLAEDIRAKRELQLKNNQHGFIYQKSANFDFYILFKNFINDYKKTDKAKFSGTLKHLKLFYKKESLPCSAINETLCRGFLQYMAENLESETYSSYFKLFRRVIRYAIKDGYIKSDPCEEIINRNKDASKLKKDYLLPKEMKQLLKGECSNNDVRQGGILAYFSGLRGCDIRSLRWREVKLAEKILDLDQNKTDHRATIPLHPQAIKLFSNPGKKNQLVFPLFPTDRKQLQKIMKRWVKSSELEKHITFHCFRHSTATNLLANNTDPITVMNLMGWKSLRMLTKYAHVIPELKRKAIAGLK